jgi:hypothetical protein
LRAQIAQPRPSARYEWNGCGTAWGKHVYATGDDVETAPLACIRTDRVLLSVYDLRTAVPTRAHRRSNSRPRSWRLPDRSRVAHRSAVVSAA